MKTHSDAEENGWTKLDVRVDLGCSPLVPGDDKFVTNRAYTVSNISSDGLS